MITFGYQILREAQKGLIAEGETQHICVDSNGKTKSLPEKYLNVLVG